MQAIIKSMILFFSVSVCAYNVQQVKQLQSLVESKSFINASGCDFRGLGDLFKGLNLNGAQLCGASFGSISKNPIVQPGLKQKSGQISDLSNVNFSNAMLVSANFENAILKNANFSGADLLYVNFSGADLTGVDLDAAKNATSALYAQTIMPDGKKHTGSTWTSSAGKVYPLHVLS